MRSRRCEGSHLALRANVNDQVQMPVSKANKQNLPYERVVKGPEIRCKLPMAGTANVTSQARLSCPSRIAAAGICRVGFA